MGVWITFGRAETEHFIDVARISYAKFYQKNVDTLHGPQTITAVDLVADSCALTIVGKGEVESVRRALKAHIGGEG